MSLYATHSHSLYAASFKQVNMDPEVGQILYGITDCLWFHYTAKRLQQQKGTGNLILRADIPVQTKLFVSADKQRKVCMSVEK